jgi:hypothetical protein
MIAQIWAPLHRRKIKRTAVDMATDRSEQVVVCTAEPPTRPAYNAEEVQSTALVL